MTRTARIAVRLFLFAAVATGGGARAQPLQLPGAQPFNPPGSSAAPPPGAPSAPAKPRAPSMPALKVPTEESILDRPLRHNGARGEATFVRGPSGPGLKLNADGFQTDNLTEPCAISFGDAPIPLTALGKPEGVPRYRLEAAACPIVFDVLEGAFLVVEPAQPCVIEAAACRVDPRGLWGPDGRTLAGRVKEIEGERGRADRAVREGYRALTAKAEPYEKRSIAREQASFSSERELICREFQREGTHGFCATRITEGRAASIRARLGLPEAPPKPATPRPAQRRTPALPPPGAPMSLQ